MSVRNETLLSTNTIPI